MQGVTLTKVSVFTPCHGQIPCRNGVGSHPAVRAVTNDL